MAGKSKDRKKRKGKKWKPTVKGCRGCPALCCHDMVMRILKPRTRAEIDELKWQVQYDTVRVFITSNRWHLLVDGRCMHLDKKSRCTIYGDRPLKCRRHNPPDCERYGEYWDVMINTPEELEAYLAEQQERGAKARRKRRSKQLAVSSSQ